MAVWIKGTNITIYHDKNCNINRQYTINKKVNLINKLFVFFKSIF